MNDEDDLLTLGEFLNKASFEEVFEYMEETYPCQGEEDEYRALFEGYKRLCPVESNKEPLDFFLNTLDDPDNYPTIELWAEPYMTATSGYRPFSWYTFSEDISRLDPEEVLGLKVMEEDEYGKYVVGTMLWEMNWGLHLVSGDTNDMKAAESDICNGRYIEWPAKGTRIVCKDEEMPFKLSDDIARGNIVTNKTRNVLYDKESKRLITNEWFEQIDYTPNPDVYKVYKFSTGNNGSQVVLRNLFNVKTGKLVLDSWVSDVIWLNHLTIFGVLQDDHWNAYDIEKNCFVLKENYEELQPMKLTTCLSVKKSGKWNVVYLPTGEYCLKEWFDDAYAVGETVFVVERDNLYNVFDTCKNTYYFPNWEELVWSTGVMGFYVVKRNGLCNVFNVEKNDDKFIVGLGGIFRSELYDIYIVKRDGRWNLLKLTERTFILDDWYDSITMRENEPAFFNVVRNGERGVINVFGKEFMTMERYESLSKE